VIPRVDRRAFVAGIGGALLVASLAAEAQPTGKVYRIGVLSPISQSPGIEALREGLRALGSRHRPSIGRRKV